MYNNNNNYYYYDYYYNYYYNNYNKLQQLQLQLHCAASNCLSVHWFIRSAIRHSQQATSYRFPIFETSTTALCGTYWYCGKPFDCVFHSVVPESFVIDDVCFFTANRK